MLWPLTLALRSELPQYVPTTAGAWVCGLERDNHAATEHLLFGARVGSGLLFGDEFLSDVHVPGSKRSRWEWIPARQRHPPRRLGRMERMSESPAAVLRGGGCEGGLDEIGDDEDNGAVACLRP